MSGHDSAHDGAHDGVHDSAHGGVHHAGADGTPAPSTAADALHAAPHGLLAAGPRVEVALEVNGAAVRVHTAPMRRLLDVLRVELGLTGTKEGCGEGECGACTVLLDGEPVNACLVAIVQCEGRRIETIEGIGARAPGVLQPVQAAFVRHGGAQCGICTPAMVVTATWLVDRAHAGHGLPAGGVREGIAGNICRCTGYNAIVDAVDDALRAATDDAVSADAPGEGR